MCLAYLTSRTTSADKNPANSSDGAVGEMSATNILKNLNFLDIPE
jgi:hypothetical protein